MQDKIPSGQLISAIDFVSKAINNSSPIQALTCVLVEPREQGGGLRIVGSNTEITCSCLCGGRFPGKFALPKQKFHTFLKTIGLGVEIEVFMEDNRLQIVGAGGKASIPVISGDEYPSIPTATGQPITKQTELLSSAISFAGEGCNLSSKDMMETLVRVEISEGSIECFGTDRKSVFLFGSGEAQFDASTFSFPKKYASAICELLSKSGSVVTLSENMVSVQAGDQSVFVKLAESGYPDVRAFAAMLVPVGRADCDALLQAFTAANALKTETEFAGVKFVSSGGMLPVLNLQCETTAGKYIRQVGFKPSDNSPQLDLSIDAERAISALSTMIAEVEILCIPGRAIAFRRGSKTAIMAIIQGK